MAVVISKLAVTLHSRDIRKAVVNVITVCHFSLSFIMKHRLFFTSLLIYDYITNDMYTATLYTIAFKLCL